MAIDLKIMDLEENMYGPISQLKALADLVRAVEVTNLNPSNTHGIAEIINSAAMEIEKLVKDRMEK